MVQSNGKKVAVLMSTYNGEMFLREQIESILAQKDVDVTIYVRDDGSKDNTLQILSEYIGDKFIVEQGENLGPAKSFMSLLYSVPDFFDYYAFSDQDDIWYPDKICSAIAMLSSRNGMLYGCNQMLVDSEGNELGLWRKDDFKASLTPIRVIMNNSISGCTTVFSNKLYRIVTKEEHRPSEQLLSLRYHDNWIVAVASLYESVVYDYRAFINYRQHGDNVVGAICHKSGFLRKIYNFIHPSKRNFCSIFARELCEKFPAESEKFPLLKICSYSRTFKQKRNIIKHIKEIYGDEFEVTRYFYVLRGLF